MNGSRKWTIEEVETLAEYFRIPAGRLLGDPSELLDPGLRATGTSGGTSAYVSPDNDFRLIQFPQVTATGPLLDGLATVTVLASRRPQPSLAVAI